MISLALWAIFALLIVHLCSLLETTLFCVRTSALAERASLGSSGAKHLLNIKQRHVDDAIGAILVLNTLAGTVGLTFAGASAAERFGGQQLGIVSAALTVLLLIFSELIPKALAARHAGSLSNFAGYVLFHLVRVLSPILAITRAIVRMVARRPGERFTRRELAALIAHAPLEGVITAGESTLIGNLIYSTTVTLRDAMTPAAIVLSMEAGQTVDELIRTPQAGAFSRIPLFDGSPDKIIGYVSQRDVLRACMSGDPRDRKLKEYLRALPSFSELMTVGPAVEELLAHHEGMALVLGNSQRPVGIVTLEDLLEAILGMEITDEADDISGLRPAIAESRRSRAAALRRRRSGQGPLNDRQK